MWQIVEDRTSPEEQQRRLIKRFARVLPERKRSSDNPLQAVWLSLHRYAGLQRAHKLFVRTADDKIKNFCAYIELAYSYASLAEEATESLDPLLLYYSAMWLARAIIAVKLGIDAAIAQRSHGAAPNPDKSQHLKMLAGSIRMGQRGTIPRLIHALGGNVTRDQSFAILDLLRALPEMDYILGDTVGQNTTSIHVYVHPDVYNRLTGDHQIQFRLDEITIGQLPIAAALNDRKATIIELKEGTCCVAWSCDHNIEEELSTLFINSPNGYFAETRIDGSYLPELTIYLSVLHAFSEFTRYYPREWLDVYAEHGNDYALVREFMHLAERKVPELALAELGDIREHFHHD